MHQHRGGYWLAWNIVTGSCLALGTAVTMLVDPPVAVILMAIMAAGAACLLTTVVKQGKRSSAGFVLRTAPLVLLVLAGVNGLVATLGAATVPLIAVLLLAGVPLVWRRKEPEAPPPMKTVIAAPPKPVKPAKPLVAAVNAEAATEASAGVTDSSPAERPTTASLCWTWRTSFTALRKADGIDERLRIVDLRQRCLDELARREPGGFHKWLADGARAAGDPTRYVCIQRKLPPED
jgi:hypothetical protein